MPQVTPAMPKNVARRAAPPKDSVAMNVAKNSRDRSAASASCQKRFVATRCTSAAAMPAARSRGTVRRIRPAARAQPPRDPHHGRASARAQMYAATKLAASAMPHGRASRGCRDGPRR